MASKSPVAAKQDQELMVDLWSDQYRLYPERCWRRNHGDYCLYVKLIYSYD
jgi:hypothetical protein